MVRHTTTIRIGFDIKKKLDKLKEHPRETYEDIIIRLIPKSEKEKWQEYQSKRLSEKKTRELVSFELPKHETMAEESERKYGKEALLDSDPDNIEYDEEDEDENDD